MATDRELVQQIQSGESKAYTELHRKYYQQIYRICISMAKNPQDAEELTQEMFILAYLKVDQLRDPDKFFPWLKKMAYNRSRNFLQRKEDDPIPLSIVNTDKNSASPEEEIIRQELINAIMDAIEALPIGDRDLVKARIDGLSHAEIGKHFGITPRASLSRLYRVRKKLTDCLKGLYGIFGLMTAQSFKKALIGGVTLMKVGVRTKIIISVISSLMLGFIVFQIVTHHPDIEISDSAIQQQSEQKTYAKQSAQSDITGKNVSEKQDSKQTEDRSNIKAEKKQTEDALAWLGSLEGSDALQLSAKNGQENATKKREEIYNGMTREEVEVAITEVEKEIYNNLARVGFLYDELMEVTEGRKPCPPGTTPKEMWDECLGKFQYVSRELRLKHALYADALGIEHGVPFQPGGWASELIKNTSMGF